MEAGFFDALRSLIPFPSNAKQKFRKLLADYFGIDDEKILLIGSGRQALYFLFKSLPDYETVIMPAFTCRLVGDAAYMAGKKVKFVDVSLDDYNLVPELLEKRIVKHSIVVVTNQFGIPSQTREIKRICEKHDCLLIEDMAEAFGTEIGGKKVGTFGDAAILSFSVSKTISTARGGAIFLNNPKPWSGKLEKVINAEMNPEGLVRALKHCFTAGTYNFFANGIVYGNIILPLWIRRHGLYTDKGIYTTKKNSFYTDNYTQMQARLGLIVFSRLDSIIKRRQSIAKRYIRELSGIKTLGFPKLSEGSVLSRFPILIRNENKTEFYFRALQKNIDLGFTFSYSMSRDKKNDPNAEFIGQQILNLPITTKISDAEVDYVIKSIKEVAKGADKPPQLLF
ncbi:MAG: DegT/DnrJ/EryC1/StrS aminotransferase family protein [Candidatus Diapherotrites archaeon]|nr:DegT/DnrJ/EryC1/StrS aminotransferase family protein [Candidatus Diapherotrites archaeon]